MKNKNKKKTMGRNTHRAHSQFDIEHSFNGVLNKKINKLDEISEKCEIESTSSLEKKFFFSPILNFRKCIFLASYFSNGIKRRKNNEDK